ncbi:MAG: pyridoxal phosphate-dependent class II aminotransferase [Oscillospiraceae bacterium]|nr:pyridoxal phosphate-dependent class II aminotransferase [Oscillospiraceae bacterium]
MVKKIHGGDIYTDRGLPAGTVLLDFSANLNPLGMPQAVQDALCRDVRAYQSYPDPQCRELRRAVGQYHGIPAEWVVCGNGAADVIWRLVLNQKPRRALLPAPAFSEYADALESVDCAISYYDLPMAKQFVPDDGFLKALLPGIDICFFCNPNNPTGIAMESGWIHRLMARCRETGTLLVLDECFTDFLEEEERYSALPFLRDFPGTVILKAFTKMYAMAGIRLGYGICADERFVAGIQQTGQAWSVSTPAARCGIAALSQRDFVARTKRLIAQERAFLQAGLAACGLKVYDGRANYLFLKAPVLDLPQRLEQLGILIRSCGNYRGLDRSYCRVAVRDRADNIRLLEGIRRVLEIQTASKADEGSEEKWQNRL